MPISRFVPPLDNLRAASRASLQSFELSKLNHAANLRREISALIDQWIQETAEATLARYMLDHHESLHDSPSSSAQTISAFPEPAVDPLPDSASPLGDIVCAPPRFSGARRPETRPMGRKSQKLRSTAVG
jgi:hypothetical protein